MATITCVPAAPVAAGDFCRITVAGGDANDLTAFDDQEYPTSPEFRYYLLFDNPAGDDGRSYEFNVSADGDHVFNNYMFPNSGSWTIRLKDASDDSDVATASVTVS